MLRKSLQELSIEQKTVLQAFSRALGREAHVLAQRPDLLWQYLFNHLHWKGSPLPGHLSIEEELQNHPGSFIHNQACLRSLP